MAIKTLDDTNLLTVKFRIRGTLIYLSHAQMLRLFQRACARADINLQFSQGMNPHPKMSLPLPRPVAVESDNELLTMRIHTGDDAGDSRMLCDTIKIELSRQLPAGCELISVDFAEPGQSFIPILATYIIPLRQDCLDERLRLAIDNLLASESVVVRREHRSTDNKNGTSYKIVDVRPFLRSLELNGTDIIAVCEITQSGAINPREIMELLGIEAHALATPIKRTNVQWQSA
jgi:radical SAM-linked protein